MVETKERNVVYTTEDSGPSAALVLLFSLIIVALLGFMIYYFSTSSTKFQSPPTINQGDTTITPVPKPVPVPAPTAPSYPSIPDSGLAPAEPKLTPAPEAEPKSMPR